MQSPHYCSTVRLYRPRVLATNPVSDNITVSPDFRNIRNTFLRLPTPPKHAFTCYEWLPMNFAYTVSRNLNYSRSLYFYCSLRSSTEGHQGRILFFWLLNCEPELEA
jgi:hypothetical protein